MDDATQEESTRMIAACLGKDMRCATMHLNILKRKSHMPCHIYGQINPGLLFNLIDGDVGIFRQLLQTFIDIAPPMMARLREAIDKDDLRQVANESHAIKGSAMVIGAEGLAALAGKLEKKARSGAAENMADDFRMMSDEMKRTIEDITHCAARSNADLLTDYAA